jgi:NAD(P)-dependent dehydrogenase (short-subunit alcohol dehydrogenase family)
MSLHGKIVLVTGGSRGIGRAISLRLAQEQPKHIFVGYCLNREAALATVAEIESQGVTASVIASDVGQVEQLEAMFSEVENRCGQLDVFVSNAARAAFRNATEISARSWQRTMDLNARAFLLGSQFAARLMSGRGGHIIAISSLGAHRCAPEYLALGAAKAAMETTARYLAVELAPAGINVNVVCGGLIETESATLHPRYEEMKSQVVARTPAGRVGRPEDLAGVVAFLCSPEASWIRGQTLIVDGGFTLTS